ncbi:MAG TPA: oligosaccharide flippase family protein [Bacteroidales bacterium]|nr:oligosaccharide flippase family protein [Bacteroidales bacterium]HQH23415.1 oligosaccharide flippase family protein [Bacteroidales bacterium]HQJ81340.1 oligosaccharide flippase family protein [Bacteroidales bacterium]
MPASSRNIIALNVSTSVIQVIITGLVYFFIYRILVLQLGVELLGVWSLTIAVASVANLSNLGFSTAIIKYVAEYDAREESEKISKLLYTSIISVSVLFIIAGILVCSLAFFFITRLVEIKYFRLAMTILPISLCGLFFVSLANILTSVLEGFQKNYIRNITCGTTSVLFLVLAIILIPRSGLVGLAIAQAIQALALFIVSCFLLSKILKGFLIKEIKWDRQAFKQLLNYGYRMQLISVGQILTEPVTKILISRFHGMNTLGFYEMASRVIGQLRQIIAGMDQITMPIVSHFQQTQKITVQYIYEKGLSFVLFIVFPLFAGIILFAPYLSKIWIGSVEKVFMNCMYILAAGMLVNVLNVQAYFNSLGEGRLNGILIMILFILLFNTLTGIVAGYFIPVYGVVIANAVASATGSVWFINNYHRTTGINLKKILKKPDLAIMAGSLLFAVFAGFVLLKISRFYDYSLISLFGMMSIYLIYFMILSRPNDNFKLLNIFQYFRNR